MNIGKKQQQTYCATRGRAQSSGLSKPLKLGFNPGSLIRNGQDRLDGTEELTINTHYLSSKEMGTGRVPSFWGDPPSLSANSRTPVCDAMPSWPVYSPH